MDRNSAYKLLKNYVKNPNLIRHGLCVEATMRAYANKFGEDEEKWAITGLLHDFDWEIHPNLEEHPMKGEPILKEAGYPEDIRLAILSHAEHSGVPRETPMQKALFAVDELSGFLVACALVKPNKQLDGVKVKSVRKKLKQASFAKQVSRDDIFEGAEELGVDLNEHIAFMLDALKDISLTEDIP